MYSSNNTVSKEELVRFGKDRNNGNNLRKEILERYAAHLEKSEEIDVGVAISMAISEASGGKYNSIAGVTFDDIDELDTFIADIAYVTASILALDESDDTIEAILKNTEKLTVGQAEIREYLVKTQAETIKRVSEQLSAGIAEIDKAMKEDRKISVENIKTLIKATTSSIKIIEEENEKEEDEDGIRIAIDEEKKKKQ